MVCAVNAALEQKHFSLRPDDNRWPNAANDSCLFDFALPNGLPGRAHIHAIGWAELRINTAINPNGDNVRSAFAGFRAGDAFATGWLERQRGAWLQSSPKRFNCRRFLLEPLASLAVEPCGYGDRGNVIT